MKYLPKVIVALLVSVVLAELVARFFLEPPLLISFVAHDHLLGHKGPANRQVMIWNNRLQYNQAGFRVIFPPKDARLDRGSVVFLGDSMVEAITIADKDHFASLFAGATSLRPYVLSAGDWGTAQEVLAFRHLRPENTKAVVLAFSSLTDFVNNGPRFANRYQSKVDELRPYARATEGAAEFYYLRPAYRLLRRASRLFLSFDNARISKTLAEPVRMHADCRQNANSIPLHVYFTDDTPEWKEAAELTALLFSELRKDAAEADAKPLAVYIPNDFELLDDKWEDSVRSPAEACWAGRPIERRENERKFLAAAKSAGLPAASLYDFFRAELAKTPELFLPDGHFNEAGHRALARAMAELAKKHGLLQ